MATGAMSLERKAALSSLLKVIQRSEKVVNLPQKLSCKVQKLTRCHMKIFLKVSKSKYFFVPGPVKSFSKFFFFLFLFIKIDAFKPTSKRFVALWQDTALRIFFVFYPFKLYNKQHYAANREPTDTKTKQRSYQLTTEGKTEKTRRLGTLKLKRTREKTKKKQTENTPHVTVPTKTSQVVVCYR